MELFKQFTEMLENFINGVVDKRLAEREPTPAVAIGLEQQVLKLLNQNGENPDTRTPVERAIIQIVKDNIPDDLVRESYMEEYCENFLDEDQAEQAVFNALRNNGHETTDIIHDNLSPTRLTEILRHEDIVEDILFDSIMQDDRFYTAVVENMVHAIQNSDYLEFPRRVRDIVADDDTLKDELRTIVKDHFADNGVFEDRVCQIIRNRL